MADYRSKYYSDSNMQIEPYYGPSTARGSDFRSYSTSYATSSPSYYYTTAPAPPKKLKKGKSVGGSVSKSWSFSDPEFQRKKRVVSYKSYSVEGKVKGSFRRSFRWIKDRCNLLIHGLW
ncbi:ABC family ABC transporter [Perilla frutescens var. frutescens]|nr:ABC family ABC transporter [Perilla frutescens var. frutescens]